jgi:glycosyltransferase involved in cell wall biosynthesis
LARRGFDVKLLAANGPIAPELEPTVRVRCTSQLKLVENSNRLAAAGQGLWNVAAAAATREVLAQCDPRSTVVHVHSWTKALSPSVLHAVARATFPTIVTLHDFFSACPNGSFYDHRRACICKRPAMSVACIGANCDSRNYPTKLYRVARQIAQRRFSRFPQAVRDYISLSELSRAVLAPYLPADARIHQLHNPIDAVAAPPAAVGVNANFVYIGRLSPEKGVTMLAEVARRIGAGVVFVGEGDERRRIESINPRARITGWLSADGVRAELREARALILPSLWYEGLPLVVMEASALGVPAAVPDTCAAAEEVEHERTGLVFRGGSAEALTEALLRLRDGQFAAALGAAARNRYLEHPATLDDHIDALLGIYERMLGETAEPAEYRKRLASERS